MDGRMFARLAAVVAIAVAVTAAAIHLAREERSTAASPSPAAETPRSNPLRETLRRCQRMGEIATNDTECLAAWDESRRRFLSRTAGN
jgi:conjugative transfer region protein TrbK